MSVTAEKVRVAVPPLLVGTIVRPVVPVAFPAASRAVTVTVRSEPETTVECVTEIPALAAL